MDSSCFARRGTCFRCYCAASLDTQTNLALIVFREWKLNICASLLLVCTCRLLRLEKPSLSVRRAFKRTRRWNVNTKTCDSHHRPGVDTQPSIGCTALVTEE